MTAPIITAWFDGACEPRNPGGHASYGALVRVGGETVLAESGYIGHGPRMSNNVAEYSGAIVVLRKIAELDGVADVRGDSRLVIEQLTGRWRVRTEGGLYVPYYREAAAILAPIRKRVRLRWIPREQNAEADALSKAVLKERGVTFRLQREEAAC